MTYGVGRFVMMQQIGIPATVVFNHKDSQRKKEAQRESRFDTRKGYKIKVDGVFSIFNYQLLIVIRQTKKYLQKTTGQGRKYYVSRHAWRCLPYCGSRFSALSFSYALL